MQLGVSVYKIEESNERSADFHLSKAGMTCIAEVKEFSPNEQEKLSIKSMEQTGVGTPVGGKPGERVRNKIKTAMPQLQKLAKNDQPGVLVLYYNVPDLLGDGCASPYNILTAMYGLQTVSSLRNAVPYPDKFGGGRSTRQDANTTLSAIMVIRDFPGELSASVYHNFYAKNALPFNFFKGETCKHYTLENGSENTFQQFKIVAEGHNA